MPDQDSDEFDLFKTLRSKLGITALLTLANGLRDGQRRIVDRLDLLQKTITQGQRKAMTLVQDIFQAQAENAVIILGAIDALATKTSELQAAVDAFLAGTATQEELQQVLENSRSLTADAGRLKESIAATAINLPTPTPENPVPPVVEPLPVPENLEDVVITETPENVALDGISAIDLPSTESNEF